MNKLIFIIIILFVHNIKLNGIYRIDSYKNNYSLTLLNNKLIFTNKNKKQNNNQLFRILQNKNGSYSIESLILNKSIILNKKNELILNNLGELDKSIMIWNIIKIYKNNYLIRNKKTKNYLEQKNNSLQCLNNISIQNPQTKIKIKNEFLFTFIKIYEEVYNQNKYIKIIENEPIDVIIKYIDLTDKSLNRTGIKQIKKDEDNEELRYSIRSILTYIPWIRKIYIIMPNNKVKYFKPLDEIKEKIIYIKDKYLLGFDSANIFAFLINLYKMENFGISNNFLYMDDDCFIGQSLKKSDFFYYDEKEKKVVPCILSSYFKEISKNEIYNKFNQLLKLKNSIKPHSYLEWKFSLVNNAKFFVDNYKEPFIYSNPTHNTISFNIDDLKEIYIEIKQKYIYANTIIYSLERHIFGFHFQQLYNLYQLNIKKRKVKSIEYKYYNVKNISIDKLYVKLFVINTDGDTKYTTKDYLLEKKVLQKRFPNPTKYEIIDILNFSSYKLKNLIYVFILTIILNLLKCYIYFYHKK